MEKTTRKRKEDLMNYILNNVEGIKNLYKNKKELHGCSAEGLSVELRKKNAWDCIHHAGSIHYGGILCGKSRSRNRTKPQKQGVQECGKLFKWGNG